MYYKKFEKEDKTALPLDDDFGTETLVLSAILTAGVPEVQETLGSSHSLTLRSGYPATSLINLLLTGFPSPFCFDGNKTRDSTSSAGIMSKDQLQAIADGSNSAKELVGVQKRSLVGFLSKEVKELGDYLKNPICPTWVLQLKSYANDTKAGSANGCQFAVIYRTDEVILSASDDEGSVASEQGVDLLLLLPKRSNDGATTSTEQRKIFVRPNHLVTAASPPEESSATLEDRVNEVLRLKWGDFAGIQWEEP